MISSEPRRGAMVLPWLLAVAVMGAPGGAGLEVGVDPRVELFCVVARLAGYPEYGQARVKRYAEAVDAHFGRFAGHAVVEEAKRLRRERGISYDAVMSLAVHVADAEGLEHRVPLDPRPESLDKRWRPEEAEAFLGMLRDFVRVSGFAGFLEEHRALHEEGAERLRRLVEERIDVGWFEAFFGSRPSGGFEVSLGMLNGPSNYGARCRLADGSEEFHAVVGAWLVDGEGLPRFDRTASETLVHEFVHSYANPVVDAHLGELERAGKALYGPVARQMQRQAYGNWETMMRELLVRACTIRYLRARGEGAAAVGRALDDRMRGFALAGELATLLEEYEADRAAYPTLEAFVPRVVGFLEERAPVR
jgi:hypothetical protein